MIQSARHNSLIDFNYHFLFFLKNDPQTERYNLLEQIVTSLIVLLLVLFRKINENNNIMI